MGTSVTPSPTQGADPQGVPNLPRILSPDEFNQARMLSPTQLSQAKFPVLPPPYVPKDAVKTLDPNTPTDKGTQLPGLAGILMRQVVSPLAAHPVLAAGITAAQLTPLAPAVDYTMMGMMGKDILDYSAQKAAEQTLPPDIKAQAEKDPDRISGEQAGVEAAMMGLVPAIKGAAKGVGKVADAALNKVTEGTRAKVAGHVDAISDAFNKMFAPASRTPESKGMADIMRATTGEQAAAYEQASFQLDQFRRAINPLPDADKLGFIDAVEGGKAQASPEFQKAADTMRKISDETWNHIVTLRPDAADSYIQDYFPHRWKDPEMAKVVFGADKAPVPTAETGPDIPRPRTASGRLKNLGSATTEELANEYALAKSGDPRIEPEVGPPKAGGPDRVFHGTSSAFDQFDGSKSDPNALYGPGHYFTENPRIASSYTKKGGGVAPNVKVASIDIKKPFNADAEIGDAENYERVSDSPAIKRIFASAEKLAPNHDWDYGKELLDERGGDHNVIGQDVYRVLSKMVDGDGIEAKRAKANEILKDAGYDGITHIGGQRKSDPHRVWVAFDKSQIHEGGSALAPTSNAALTGKLETELTKRGISPRDALTHGQAAVDAQNAKAGAPTSTDDALVKAQRQTGSKRPMEGSKNFLKSRTIPTTAEGMALGLEPVSTNPVDLFLLDLRNKQKFIMAHETLTQGKDAGFIKFFPGALDDGYKPIDDKVATVFGPRHPDTGMNTIAGRYAAPEPVATIINNYLSPGLRGNPIYDAYKGLGNTLNQAQLGLSAFHLGMTSIDATVSRAALGLEYLHTALKTGDPDAAMMGMKKLATAPGAPFAAIAQGLVGDPLNAKFGTNIQLGMGAKVRAAYLNPESATPEFRALANAMKEAGGRARMDSFYANSSPEKFMAALHEHDPVGMAKMALPAFFETASKPIMEHIVPLQKMQVFGEMAQKVLGDLPPEATLAERRAALASAWDSVDNRMGQLVYDNLFWNKTFKDLAMGSVRSVGWNIGTIREVAGGALDVPKLLHGELTHSAAYALTLPIVVGMYGATYQYLRTGKGPEELKDYYFPKTGEQDADGNDERVQLPTYMKDVFAYTRHPGQTLVNKLGPLPEAIAEQYRNQNFFGDQIRNPDDPLVKQLTQEAEWMGKTIEPFAFTNMGEQAKRSDVGTASKLGNWFGVTPAHREDVRTTAQNDMADMAAKRGHAELTPEEQDAAGQRRDILAGLRGNGNIDVNEAVNQALQSGGIVPADLGKLMKRAGLTPAQERFKSLSTAQALKIFQEATPKEQGMFAELLAKKIESAEKRGSGL